MVNNSERTANLAKLHNMTHLQNLLAHIPDLKQRKILDIGCGRGAFIIEATEMGISAVGIDPKENTLPNVYIGTAESLEFDDNTFDFINLSQVLEHVHDPEKVIAEMSRVMRPGALGYIGVPARFGAKDEHFHLWFLNWMPRAWARQYVTLRGRDKNYDRRHGVQRIDEMHYYTYRGIQKLLTRHSLHTQDIRMLRINSMIWYKRIPVKIGYMLLRPFVWDSFHLLVIRV